MMITLCFTRPKKWTLVSWLIKLFTRSAVSHVAIGLEVWGVPFLLHSTMGGVQLVPRARYERGNEIVEEYVILPDMTDRVLELMSMYIGEAYDYLALPGHAILLTIWYWFRLRIKNPLASPTSYVCSELVLHLNRCGDLPEWNGFEYEETNAEDLRAQCAKEISFKRLQP